jgi:hypothetical protein
MTPNIHCLNILKQLARMFNPLRQLFFQATSFARLPLPGHMPRDAPPLLRQQRLPLPTITDAPGVLEQSVRFKNFRQPDKTLPPWIVQGQEEFLAVEDGGIGLAGVVAKRECAAVQVDGLCSVFRKGCKSVWLYVCSDRSVCHFQSVLTYIRGTCLSCIFSIIHRRCPHTQHHHEQ